MDLDGIKGMSILWCMNVIGSRGNSFGSSGSLEGTKCSI